MSERIVREALAMALVLGAIVTVVAIFAPDAGFLIRPLHDVLAYLLGWGIVFAPPLLAGLAFMLAMRSLLAERWLAAAGAAVFSVALLGMLHLAGGGGADLVDRGEGGGLLGFLVTATLTAAIGIPGSWAVLGVLSAVGLLLYFNVTLGDLLAAYLVYREQRAAARAEEERRGAAGRPAARAAVRVEADPEPRTSEARPGLLARVMGSERHHDQEGAGPLILRRERPATAPRPPIGAAPARAGTPVPVGAVGDATSALRTAGPPGDGGLTVADRDDVAGVDVALAEELRTWELPALALLADAAPSAVAQLDLAAKGQLIRQTLANFRIGVKVARIQEGPVVTQYALDVEPGIKLSRIEGLADNLALALSARSIRIEAPISGQPYVGIEIPNTAFDLVTLKEVLASKAFDEVSARSKLAFALGQDVAGQPHAADLSRMPHVLIAGATGSGKSVCVNALICSLLVRATPAEVKFIMIDPKRVEMAQYRGIPHLLTEVIVDPEKAVNALKWTVGTMEARYHDFAQRGVRNIAGYNESLRPGEPEMPYVVVVIDELADLMMVSAYEVEATVTRVAQLARATGIHLVVATQRPSVQVVTGLIKANIPSRIAFAMTSGVDSRTILDTTGAEDLLGRGDMLYQPIDAARAVRLQGVLVTDAEIDALARHWREQGGPQYRPEITAAKGGAKGTGPAGADEADDADPLLRQAVDVVRRSDRASASLLQRRLRIGYARAARILDQMEDRGIVGAADGSKFREVLITADGWGGDVAPGDDREP
ncbi:MAG: DNA translocase FtsK 4TM domain-containing protein [Candidatus Limnocylindria bacterium]